MDIQQIIQHLPYSKPFLFVNEITQISEHGATGNYTFKEEAYFYKGHFKDNPITPGVILTEAMWLSSVGPLANPEVPFLLISSGTCSCL